MGHRPALCERTHFRECAGLSGTGHAAGVEAHGELGSGAGGTEPPDKSHYEFPRGLSPLLSSATLGLSDRRLSILTLANPDRNAILNLMKTNPNERTTPAGPGQPAPLEISRGDLSGDRSRPNHYF